MRIHLLADLRSLIRRSCRSAFPPPRTLEPRTNPDRDRFARAYKARPICVRFRLIGMRSSKRAMCRDTSRPACRAALLTFRMPARSDFTASDAWQFARGRREVQGFFCAHHWGISPTALPGVGTTLFDGSLKSNAIGYARIEGGNESTLLRQF